MPHRFEETLVQNQDVEQIMLLYQNKIIVSVQLLFSVIEAGYLHFYKPLTMKTKNRILPFFETSSCVHVKEFCNTKYAMINVRLLLKRSQIFQSFLSRMPFF